MSLQMNKVEEYAEWGNLKLNTSKCAITGMPRHDMERFGVPSPLTPLGCSRLQQQLRVVKIKGEAVPFAHPDKEPQKVLGILVTPTLNWHGQRTKLLEEAKIRSTNITESDASTRQKLSWIQTCLKPYLTYSFPLTYLSKQDISNLDAVLAQTAKRALRLPSSTPTGLVLQRQIESGAGVESLLIDYAQLSTAHLTRALNDTGKLGVISRSLLKDQHDWLGSHTTGQAGVARGQFRLIRQLELMDLAELYLRPPVIAETSKSEADRNYEIIFTRPAKPRPKHLDFHSVAGHLHTDPKFLGQSRPVPPRLYHCQAELGITNLKDLLCKNRKSSALIIDGAELKRRFGSLVQSRHLNALNKLTILAHEGTTGCTNPRLHAGSNASLAANSRTVNKDLLDAEFQKHTERWEVRGTWKPDDHAKDVQLISLAFQKALQAPARPPESKIKQVMW